MSGALWLGLGVAAMAIAGKGGSSSSCAGGVCKDLSLLHPVTAAKIADVVRFMRERRTPVLVFETLRTTERQAELYAQGRTKPGSVVTHLSGKPGQESNHQAKRDGKGRAADLVLDVKGWGLTSPRPTNPWDTGVEGGVIVRPDVLAAWKAMGAYATSRGLRWLGGPAGGALNPVSGLAFDAPHVEDNTV